MELINLRFWIAFCSETLLIVPIIIGILFWKKLNIAQKYYVLFLIAYLVTNIISIIFYLKGKAHNFSYIYSLLECIFLFQIINLFLLNRYKKIINLISIFCFLTIIFELLWLTGFKDVENSFSSTTIRLSIFVLSIYHLINLLIKESKAKYFNELNLYISLSLMVIYFFKSLFSFLMRYLLETQTNFYLYMQIENLVNLFIIISILIVSWAFYRVKKYSNNKVNE